MNLNVFESTFTGFGPIVPKPSKGQPDNNCPGHCSAKLDADFWLNNQRYWVYKCSCCGQRQIQSRNKVGGGCHE